MLKTKEFQPHTLNIRLTIQEYTCPICGNMSDYLQSYLPERCSNCHASFEWTVKAHYREEEESPS